MLLFDLSLDLDRTLAQRKAQQKAKSKVKVTHWHLWHSPSPIWHHRWVTGESLTIQQQISLCYLHSTCEDR